MDEQLVIGPRDRTSAVMTPTPRKPGQAWIWVECLPGKGMRVVRQITPDGQRGYVNKQNYVGLAALVRTADGTVEGRTFDLPEGAEAYQRFIRKYKAALQDEVAQQQIRFLERTMERAQTLAS